MKKTLYDFLFSPKIEANICPFVTGSNKMTIKVLFTVKAHEGHAKKIRDALRAQEEVLEAHTVRDGKFDVIAWIRVSSLDKYRAFIEHIAEMPDIDDFESFITVDE
ncbi:MAG: Lrp/AsnC ligand binding domain-containing protein [Candidatus Thorarchaeota archaeon]|nr:Lrp/AsnC ligand binding domain-containing protein [Candidatus Thorarchaeota archaeon]